MSCSDISEEIYKSLEILELPVLITYKELKKRYKELSRIYHPDLHKSKGDEMYKINEAYSIISSYMENYRFTFSLDEIVKQFPQDNHAEQFKF